MRRLAIAVLAAAAACARGGGDAVVATVDGRPIARSELDRALERDYGMAALDQLVSRRLVFQEAERRKVKASPQEVDAELKAMTERTFPGHSPQELARVQRKPLSSLREEARYNVLLRKLANPKVEVTDDQVRQYYDATKARWAGKPLEQVADQIRRELTYQREQAAMQTYLADLRRKAKIRQFPERLAS